MKPSIGRIVHYMSFGSKGGEYQPQCRAAVVAEVVSESSVALVVLNPGGLFFNTCTEDQDEKAGGTWHWPERTE